MKVKVIKPFRDLKEKKKRNEKDVFEVTQARFKEINGSKHGILVEEVKEKPKKETKK